MLYLYLPTCVSHISVYNEILEIDNLKREKFYFGSQLWRFCSKTEWLINGASEESSIPRWDCMTEPEWKARLRTSRVWQGPSRVHSQWCKALPQDSTSKRATESPNSATVRTKPLTDNFWGTLLLSYIIMWLGLFIYLSYYLLSFTFSLKDFLWYFL